MNDQELIAHFEKFHPDDLAMEFRPRPGKILAELSAPKEWRTYHETLHRLWPAKYDHDHNEEATELPSTEKIYVVKQDLKTLGAVMSEAAVTSLVAATGSLTKPCITEEIELHRPDLRPIYGGPTLLEALWNEMDTIMERLMTGQTSDDVCSQSGYHGVSLEDPSLVCEHEDNGDKYRAQQMAWVLAIVTDPYEPSVDKIRAETMARWNAMQQAAEETAAEQSATIQEGYGL